MTRYLCQVPRNFCLSALSIGSRRSTPEISAPRAAESCRTANVAGFPCRVLVVSIILLPAFHRAVALGFCALNSQVYFQIVVAQCGIAVAELTGRHRASWLAVRMDRRLPDE